MTIFLVSLFGFAVAGILYETWSYKRNIERVRDLLHARGPMTGMELRKAGVSRSHIYLILSKLKEGGEVQSLPAPDPKYEGQKIYKVKI